MVNPIEKFKAVSFLHMKRPEIDWPGYKKGIAFHMEFVLQTNL